MFININARLEKGFADMPFYLNVDRIMFVNERASDGFVSIHSQIVLYATVESWQLIKNKIETLQRKQLR